MPIGADREPDHKPYSSILLASRRTSPMAFAELMTIEHLTSIRLVVAVVLLVSLGPFGIVLSRCPGEC
jgi:hypothetical protein